MAMSLLVQQGLVAHHEILNYPSSTGNARTEVPQNLVVRRRRPSVHALGESYVQRQEPEPHVSQSLSPTLNPADKSPATCACRKPAHKQ